MRARGETRGEEKKNARAMRWKTRGDLLVCLGVARVHLIYRTLRRHNSETKPLPLRSSGASTGASTACRELRRSCASTLRVATFPYELQHFPTTLRCFLYDIAMFHTEGLDQFRGLPSYARFGRSDRTQNDTEQRLVILAVEQTQVSTNKITQILT